MRIGQAVDIHQLVEGRPLVRMRMFWYMQLQKVS